MVPIFEFTLVIIDELPRMELVIVDTIALELEL